MQIAHTGYASVRRLKAVIILVFASRNSNGVQARNKAAAVRLSDLAGMGDLAQHMIWLTTFYEVLMKPQHRRGNINGDPEGACAGLRPQSPEVWRLSPISTSVSELAERVLVCGAFTVFLGLLFSLSVQGVNHDESQYILAALLSQHNVIYKDYLYLQPPLHAVLLGLGILI